MMNRKGKEENDIRKMIMAGNWKSRDIDEGLYHHRVENGKIAVSNTYVDDTLITRNDEKEVDKMVRIFLGK